METGLPQVPATRAAMERAGLTSELHTRAELDAVAITASRVRRLKDRKPPAAS